jgi:cell division protein FtsL
MMTAPPIVGTTSIIDATLNAILCHLNAIELKMEPMQPHQDEVTILETTVQDHAIQQEELDSTVNKLSKAQSTPNA